MCGRFCLTRPDKLAGRLDIEPDWVPRFNIAPAQDIPVIRQHAIWCKNDDPACGGVSDPHRCG
jgi:putative SOS response-associated peptidase YedK